MRGLRLALLWMVACAAVSPVFSQEATPEATTEVVPEIDLLTYYTTLPQDRTDDGAFVLGYAEPALTVVVFSNFTCADCIAYAPVITRFIRELVAEGLARLEYRLYAVTDEAAGPYADIASCAGEQDRFWEARELLFEVSHTTTTPSAIEAEPTALPSPQEVAALVIDTLELDEAVFAACVAENDGQQILTDTLLAVELDVIGTPAVMFRVRDSAPRWLQIQGQVQNEGGLPFDVLQLAVEAANR